MYEKIAENSGLIIWIVTTVGTMLGVIVYNLKVVLPGYANKVKIMDKAIKALETKDFVTAQACDKRHLESEQLNRSAHEEVNKNVKEILACVKSESKLRIRAKMHQIGFMTAVKEKLDLEFEVPLSDA